MISDAPSEDDQLITVEGPLTEFDEGDSDKLDPLPPHHSVHLTASETAKESTAIIAEDSPLLDENGVELVFGDPLTMQDENSLDAVVQRRLMTLQSSGGQLPPPVNYKARQKTMMEALQSELHYEEDEADLLRVEKMLADERLAEQLKALAIAEEEQRQRKAAGQNRRAAAKKGRGGYEDEEDSEEEEEDAEEEEPQDEEEEDDDVNFRKPKTYTPKKATVATSTPSTPAPNTAATPTPGVGASTPGVVPAPTSAYKWVDHSKLKNSLYEELRPNLAITYPFELDEFQRQAVLRLERREHVFVTAHTSAGKTVVAEYAIALAMKNNTRCVYTSPIKALSNQKFRDFKEKFGADNVGILTGDVSVNPEARCLIMTTEIFRSMLYKGADTVRDVEFVVFDEVHYVNDSERGVVWEEVIIMLPEAVTLIFLSATTPNAAEFGEWIGRTKRKRVYLTGTAKRPVPLQHFLYFNDEAYCLMQGDKDYKPNALVDAKKRYDEKNKPKPFNAANAKMAAEREAEKAEKIAIKQGKTANQIKQIRATVIKKEIENAEKLAKQHAQQKTLVKTGPAVKGGSRAEWTALLNVLHAGGREAKGGLGAIDFGVATAKHVTLDAAVRREREKLREPYEALPTALRATLSKREYERQSQDVRVDGDGDGDREHEKDEDPDDFGLFPVVVFSFSKKKCETLADFFQGQSFLSRRAAGKVQSTLNAALDRLSPADKALPQIKRLSDMLARGVGVHHSGLLPILKETVEMLFAQSLVRVLFATETFAMGVNMPAKAVVFNGFRKHDGKTFRDLTPGEYTQMAGRAGRRGLDRVGTVVIAAFQELPVELHVRTLLVGRPLVLASQFRLRYNMILNLVRVQNLSVQEMIKSSFTEFASQKMLANHDYAVKLRRYQELLAVLERERDAALAAHCEVHGKGEERAVLQDLQVLYDSLQGLQGLMVAQWQRLASKFESSSAGKKNTATVNNSNDNNNNNSKNNDNKSNSKSGGGGVSAKVLDFGSVANANTNAAADNMTANAKGVAGKNSAAISWATRLWPRGRLVVATVAVLSRFPALCVVLTDPVRTHGLLEERRRAKEREESLAKSSTASGKLSVSIMCGGELSDAAKARHAMLGLTTPSHNATPAVGTASDSVRPPVMLAIAPTLSKPIESNSVFVLIALNELSLSPAVLAALEERAARESAFSLSDESLSLSLDAPREGFGRTSEGVAFLVARVSLSEIALTLSTTVDLESDVRGALAALLVTQPADLLPVESERETERESRKKTRTQTLQFDIVTEFDTHSAQDLDLAVHHEDVENAHGPQLLRHWTRVLCSPSHAALYQAVARCLRVEEKLRLIAHALSDETMSLFPDFQRRIGLLGQLGYLDAACKVITPKGRVCCELNTCDELVCCEMLFHNVLDPLDAAEAVAMLSALVFQEKTDAEDVFTYAMEFAKQQMTELLLKLNSLQNMEGVEIDEDARPPLNFGLCGVVYNWAKGMSFNEIMTMTEFAEGSIVRTITRLDELCRDVQKAAFVMGNPALYRKMEEASKLIKRDIVFAASLYIQ